MLRGVRVLMWFLTCLLLLLGLGLAALALGAFGNMSSGTPLWLRSLGSIEATVSTMIGNLGLQLFSRAMLLTVLASFVLALAVYIKPRA